MHVLQVIAVCFVIINLSSSITTRGSGHRWREEDSDPYPYYRDHDQYRDHSHDSYYDRRPSPSSVDDMYREAERYNYHVNPRFNRHNSWTLLDRDQLNPNTEAFFNVNNNNNNHKRQNADNYPDNNRDARETLYTPAPHLPWEDALRHSVYLTLIRDKIDNILAASKRPGVQNLETPSKDTYESSDVDLWRNIKKAPFRTNGKERGPVFGDIAILSRGKLLQNEDGFEFVEDEDFKECLECHLYSSKPNEYEAERILMRNCNEPHCKNGRIKALWTVRRIRHRNNDDDNKKFMYELMFSIASPKHDNKILDYNNPSQTFTINENDKSINGNIDKGSSKVVFLDDTSNKSHRKGKTYFNDFNVNTNNGLNTGESDIKNDEYSGINKYSSESDPRIMNEQEDNIEHVQHPVITHLHHHYYLDDKGIPMIRPSVKYDMAIPSIYDNIDSRVDPRTVPSTSNKMDTTQFNNEYSTEDSILNTNTHPTTRKFSTYNNKKYQFSSTTPKTKKNFVPSPKDERKIYSELDPLYTTTTTSKDDTKSIGFNYDNPKTISSSTTKYPNQQIINLNDKLTGDITTRVYNQEYEDFATFPDTGTTIEKIYVPEITTEHIQIANKNKEESVHIVYPETTTSIHLITESSTEKSHKRIKTERKPYKITRRIKQKTFSELLKPQEPKGLPQQISKFNNSEADMDKKTIELQQKIADVSKQFLSNKTNSFEPQKTSRQKYQRKFNTWNARRSRTGTSTTTTEKITTVESTYHTEMEEMNTETIPDIIYHTTFQDNIEGESEKDVYIDNVSVLRSNTSDSSKDEFMQNDDDHGDSNEEFKQDKNIHTSTEISTTDITDAFSDNYDDVTSLSNSNNKTIDSYKITTVSTDDDNDESAYTPLTKKSYVTSISLKLGNKTRPYYSYATRSPVQNTTIAERTTISEIVTESSEENTSEVTMKTHSDNGNTTESLKYIYSTENNHKDTESAEDDVEIARIVEHTSLHKLKIGDQK